VASIATFGRKVKVEVKVKGCHYIIKKHQINVHALDASEKLTFIGCIMLYNPKEDADP